MYKKYSILLKSVLILLAIFSFTLSSAITITCDKDSVKCKGDNGKIIVRISGATNPVTLQLYTDIPPFLGGAGILLATHTTSAATDTFTNQPVGHFFVYSYDAIPSPAISWADIVEPTTSLSGSGSVTTPLKCFGDNIGVITVTASNGWGSYQYSKDGGTTYQAGITFSGLTAATYPIVIKDKKGCTLSIPVTVTSPTLLTGSISSQTNVACNGGATGAVTVTEAGGTPGYTYLWSGGSAAGKTTAAVSALIAGNYSCKITDINGCNITVAVTITQPASLSGGAISILHGPTCNDSPDGQLMANPVGGTSPYSYQWQIRVGVIFNNIPGETSQVFTSALVGNVYRCVINDANLCGPVNASLTFIKAALPVGIRDSIPDAIVFGAPTIQNACTGQSNGSAAINITSGGVVPYNYSITTGGAAGYQISNAFNSLSGGTYQQWVQDKRNCRKQGADAVVGQDPLLPVSVTISQNPVGAFCSGTSVQFTATPVNGGASPSYQWKVNAVNVGANQNTYTTTTLANNDQVSCVLTSNVRCFSGNPATSNIITVTVNAAPIITGQPTSPAAFCSGAGTATFTVTATGTALTYQWQEFNGVTWTNIVNGGVYSGATTATLTLTNPGSGLTGFKYRAIVSGTCLPAATSDGLATLTVNSAPNITGQPTSPAAFCSGAGTATFTVTATGAGLTYQWQEFNGVTWTNIVNGGVYSGATTATLILTNPGSGLTGFKYRAIVSGTCLPAATSDGLATLTVNSAPNITGQPTSPAAFCSGAGTATFTVTATGAGLTYQWQEFNGVTWTNIVNGGVYSGATTATLTLTNPGSGLTGFKYRAIVSGTCLPAATSDGLATLTVNSAPNITGQPTSPAAFCSGAGTATFTVTATGAGLTYQWQEFNGVTWTNIVNGGVYSGATTATLTLTNPGSGLTGFKYRAIVSGTCLPAATSDGLATLTVNSAPNITGQPTSPAAFCSGAGTATFTVTATGAGLTYQWQEFNGVTWTNIVNGGVYSGATTATLTLTNPGSGLTGFKYRAIVSGTCLPAATSDGLATLTVNSAPNITGQPTSPAAFCSGAGTATFTVTATGAGLTYQWQEFNGVTWTNIVNGGVYSGATTATLILTNPGSGLTGFKYRAIVSGTCLPAATSDGLATLTVNSAPNITGQPTDISICNSLNASFNIIATGSGLIYQWEVNDGSGWTSLIDGGIYSGVSTNTLTINGALFSMNSYQYRCVVSGSCLPNITSNAAILTVTLSTGIIGQPKDVVDCEGNTVVFGVKAIGTGIITYQWQSNASGTWTNLVDGIKISGSNSDTINVKGIDINSEGYYRCVVSSDCGLPIISDSAKLHVNIITATIGKPAPFFISNTTTIEVDLGIRNHFHVDDLSYYLVAPDGTKVPLKHSYYANAGLCNFNQDVNLTFTTTKPIADTIPSTCSLIDATPGTYAATGDWHLLNGKDPANGAWRVEVEDIYTDGFNSGEIVSSNIIFTDLNISGVMESVSYISGAISVGIDDPVDDNIRTSFTPVIVPLGLSTKCSNTCDAKAIVTVAGGISPYTYTWNDVSLGNNATVSLCGNRTYSVTVTDALGCTANTSVHVTSPPPIKIDQIIFTKNDTVACFGDTTSISVKLSGGTGLIQYTINSVTKNSGQTVTALVAGVYPLHIFDQNGCTKDTSITIVQPSKFYADSLRVRNIACNGTNSGRISLKGHNGTAPYHFVLEKGGVAVGLPVTSVDSAIFTGLSAANNYLLWVTDKNGCNVDSFKNIVITEPAVLKINTIDTSNYICFGQTDGYIKFLNVTGGVRPYQYSINNGTTWQADSSFLNIAPGLNTLVVQDKNNCSATLPIVTLKGANQITINSIDITNITTCFNDPAGILKVNASGGNGTLEFSLNALPYQLDSTFNGLLAGTYAVHVQDTLTKCIVNGTATITAPAAIIIDSIVPTNVHGAVLGSFIVYAKGGAAPLEYSMDDSNYQTSDTFPNLNVGLYYVYVKDSRGCKTAKDSVYISSLTVTVTKTDVTCKGGNTGSITLSVLEPGTFQYSIDGGVTTQTTGTFTNLTAKNYFVKVTDGVGGQFNQVVTIQEPDTAISIFAVLPASPTCFNGNNGVINISAEGEAPLQFSIDNGTTFFFNNQFQNVNAGIYPVVVQDVNGCTKSVNTTVVNPSPIAITVNVANEIGLVKGSIKIVSVLHGTPPYLFSINGGPTQTDSTFANLSAGLYTITTSDVNCSHDTTVRVNNGIPLNVFDIVTGNNCPGDKNGVISIGFNDMVYANPVLFKIEGPDTIQALNNDMYTFPNLKGGDYLLTVTDNVGAVFQKVITVTDPAPFIFNASVVNATCNNNSVDGSISLSVTGGTTPYTYLWNTVTNDATPSLSNLHMGVYTITVTDFNSCIATQTYRVNSKDTVIANAGLPVQFTCPKVPVFLNATGGTTYSWYPPNGLSSTIVPNPILITDTTGVYNVSVTKNSCTDNTFIIVSVYYKYDLRIGIQTSTGIAIKDSTYLGLNVPLQLIALPDSFVSYQWFPPDYLDDATSRTPIVTVPTPIATTRPWYYITARTSDGCFQTDSIKIIVRSHPKIPSGFTPSAGLNPYWEIPGAEAYPGMHVAVYNRWGELVYESTGYDTSRHFDGKRNGRFLPAGTYYYIIDFRDGTAAETGSVTIVSIGQ